MMKAIRRVLRREGGASAVEFALIAPLFFMITFGMISGAIAFNQKNQMTHAAREGARYGATLNPEDWETDQSGWADNIIAVTRDRSFGDLGDSVDGAGVCVALVDGNPGAVVDNYWSDFGSTVNPPSFTSGEPCFDEDLSATSDPGQR